VVAGSNPAGPIERLRKTAAAGPFQRSTIRATKLSERRRTDSTSNGFEKPGQAPAHDGAAYRTQEVAGSSRLAPP